MPKFVEQIIENLLWTEISFENPVFLSGSEEEIPDFPDEEPEVPNQGNNWHKSEAEIKEDGHVW